MKNLPPIETDLQAHPDKIWKTLTDFRSYADWNSIVPFATGKFEPGQELRITLILPGDRVESGPCKVEAIKENEYYILSRKMVFKWILYLEHAFIIQPIEPELNKYKFIQHLKGSGLLWSIMAPRMKKVWAHFQLMNEDLKTQVEKPKHYGPAKRFA